MARFYRDFSSDTPGSPAAGFSIKISRSGDSANVSQDFTYGNFLNVFKGGTSGSLAVAWDVLNGIQDVEQLIKFRTGGAAPTSGRYGLLLNRYDGTTEATTRGFSAVFTPAVSVPSIIINEDSVGTVHYINYAWENNKMYWARFRVNGNDQMFKIWPDGEDEPPAWTLAGTFAGSTIANPYSGVGNFTNWSNIHVFQISAGTNGDTAPKDNSFQVPSSTPIVGYGGGYGAATGYGVAYGEALRPSFPPPADIYHDHSLQHVTISENWTLAVNPVNQGHSLQHVALTQAHTLSVASLQHGHTLEATRVLKKTKLKGAIVDIRQNVKALDVLDVRPRGEYYRTRAQAPTLRRKQKPRIHIERQRPHQP